MKTLLNSLSILMLILLIQCGKSTNPEPAYSLIGNWQWVKSEGGLGLYSVNTIITPESESLYRLYEFHDDSSFSFTEILIDGMNSMRDGFSGNYHITYDTSSGENNSRYVLHYGPHRSFNYKLAKDSLFLTELFCCNYYKQTYVRVAE